MILGPKQHREHLRKLRQDIEIGDWGVPTHLSDVSKAVWRSVVPERIRSPEKRFALVVALEARDELSRIHSELITADLVSTTKRSGALHINPLIPHAARLRKDFFKSWAALGLNHNGPIDSPNMQLINNPDEASSCAGVQY